MCISGLLPGEGTTVSRNRSGVTVGEGAPLLDVHMGDEVGAVRGSDEVETEE